ncbi:oxygenase MpaB family protein [Kineococcus sp. DHX-1]|uniref:oxygenase MpaB family protein n=1 Tax=Kineococcus sp. DHX-1 TaxID=3349638 RepID=UPI0036D339D3
MWATPCAATRSRSALRTSDRFRARFRRRVSGDPSGAPDWVRAIATVGGGPGWFAPDGVVWRVHGDLSTLVGGVAALLGQGTHPLALAGVQRHSSYRTDPWGRLAGTARWLTVTTFGSAQLAEREAARVRAMHLRVRGTAPDGQSYSASDPGLLRWVHLAFTDAFLAAQDACGHDLAQRFGPRWGDAYVADWARSAQALGALDLPTSRSELAEALQEQRPGLVPVPDDLRAFITGPTGLGGAERLVYRRIARAGSLVLSPTLADLAGVPGRRRSSTSVRLRLELAAARASLRALQLTLGPHSPSERAARYRLGLGPRPEWLTQDDVPKTV